MADCRAPPSRALAALETEAPPEILEDITDPVYDTEYVEGDLGPVLMLRRSFFTPRAPTNDWLRNSIFQSSCTIAGKVCCFIIDSGSCENVISESVLSKLGLVTKAHPCPYKLAWLSKGSDIMVTRLGMVSLSIGSSYTDDVMCDIVPMDACHVLLGRPWQYDRSVFHDGRNNTCSFLFRGKKIVLMPSPAPKSPPSAPAITLLSR